MFDRVATVTLPAQVPVEFPDQCVRCGHAPPRHAALLITRDARYHIAFWAGWRAFRVPACRGCAVWLHLWRWWAFARTLLVGAAGVAFGVFVLLPRLPGFATGMVVLSLIGAAFLVLFVIDRRFPPSFNIDRRGAITDYEFRRVSYAEQFAALNDAYPERAA